MNTIQSAMADVVLVTWIALAAGSATTTAAVAQTTPTSMSLAGEIAAVGATISNLFHAAGANAQLAVTEDAAGQAPASVNYISIEYRTNKSGVVNGMVMHAPDLAASTGENVNFTFSVVSRNQIGGERLEQTFEATFAIDADGEYELLVEAPHYYLAWSCFGNPRICSCFKWTAHIQVQFGERQLGDFDLRDCMATPLEFSAMNLRAADGTFARRAPPTSRLFLPFILQ